VNHRLEHVDAYLDDFCLGDPTAMMVALWSVRALQDESRQAGHRDLSELCRRMERGILKRQMARREDSEDLAAEIAGIVEYIRQEARKACYSTETACGPEWTAEADTGKEESRLVPAAV
jgi:hypothetical protein